MSWQEVKKRRLKIGGEIEKKYKNSVILAILDRDFDNILWLFFNVLRRVLAKEKYRSYNWAKKFSNNIDLVEFKISFASNHEF